VICSKWRKTRHAIRLLYPLPHSAVFTMSVPPSDGMDVR